MTDEVVFAAGGIVTRLRGAVPEVLLVHRPRHRDWSLPKGKLEAGEGFEAAALREVWEETGCEATAREFAGTTSSVSNARPKVVLFWAMDVVREQARAPDDEIDAVAWLAVDEALKRMSYEAERQLVRASVRGGATTGAPR